eukprot:m.89883 g.89883  ORF g.89883 m.89883 type:complete len:773 (+) comp36630_c0_seq4:87-2405(+)
MAFLNQVGQPARMAGNSPKVAFDDVSFSAAARSPEIEPGLWEEVRKLGAGGFGFVTLWKHVRSDNKMAVKTCKETLSDINKSRWRQEVEMMYKLDHPNVVKAITVPQCLQGDEATLGMEWCEEGNLRHWFHKPGNQCGLPEDEVLALMNDVGSAIEYLHQNAIIHRDIKPENIVLKRGPERIVFKLIDLGYAKEAERSTFVHTFVGTFVYLAPELFVAKSSSAKAVDYWTFGVSVFEAITGQRPFPLFPGEFPVNWHQRLMEKHEDHIYCVYGKEGNIQYSSEIHLPHNLTSPLIEVVADWLRLMLQLDDHKRGGPVDSFTQRRKAFLLLDNLLAIKIVMFHHMNSGRSLCFKVIPRDSLAVYQNELAKRWDLSKERQLVVNKSGEQIFSDCGIYPEKNARVAEFYVIDSDGPLDASAAEVSLDKALSEVQAVVEEPDVLITVADRSFLWRHSVYFCQNLMKSYMSLYRGAEAFRVWTFPEYERLQSKLKELVSKTYQLEGKRKFFNSAHSYDLNKLKERRFATDHDREDLLADWERFAEEGSKISPMRGLPACEKKMNEIDSVKAVVDSSPFNNSYCNETLQKFVLEAQKMLKGLSIKDSVKAFDTNEKMEKCLRRCCQERNALTSGLFNYVEALRKLRVLVGRLLPEVDSALATVKAIDQRLTDFQKTKQSDLWEKIVHKRRLHSYTGSSHGSSDPTGSIGSGSWGSFAASRLYSRENSYAHEDTLAAIKESHSAVEQLGSIVNDFKSLHVQSESQTEIWTIDGFDERDH